MSSNTVNVLLIKFGFMPDGLVCGHDDGEDRHLLLDVDGLEAVERRGWGSRRH